jgi:methylenetetrahydrofolate dehydrogenase (NADP+)/methenyltetrahydrofolate cyclohydrolase
VLNEHEPDDDQGRHDLRVNRVDDARNEKGYRLTGDVDFEGVSQVASAITPVPGGVGPMTIAMLLSNTLDAALASHA